MDKNEIVPFLLAIEPDLPRLSSRLTAADQTVVEELTHDARPRVRANALTLQSLIDEAGFMASFRGALGDPERIVKLQALASIGNVSAATAAALADATRQFMEDPDAGVRKLAVKAAVRSADEETTAVLERLAGSDEATFVRSLAMDTLSKLQ